MNPKFMSFIIKASIILMALFGLTICAVWYPLVISFTTKGISPDLDPTTTAQYIEYYTQLAFYWATSLPCFIILACFWKIGNAIKKNLLFTTKTAKTITTCVRILLVDLIVFIIGNLSFIFIGWSLYFEFIYVIYLAIAVIGLIITGCLAILSHFVTQGALLKEEVDLTI